MVLDPFLLLWFFRLLHYIVPKLIVSDDEGVCSLSILDAVGVIIVLRRGLDDVALGSHSVHERHVIRHLGCLVGFNLHRVQFFLEVHLIVAE